MEKGILTRQSNFELLRILCMLGVMFNHVMQYLYDLHTPQITMCNTFRIFLMNICMVAVNCFVLISGYFGIKLGAKSIVKYYIQCVFYSIVIYLLNSCCSRHFSLIESIKALFACSESSLWFIPAYLGLMLFSPILNAAFNVGDRRTKFFYVVFVLVADVYVGYIHQSEMLSVDGYNVVHLITVYCVGRYISFIPFHETKKWWWGAFVMFVSMTILHAIKMRFFPISVIYSMHYNSPCMIVASCLVFLCFRNIKLSSRMVNYIASSVLAVYLIHSNPHVWPYFVHFLKVSINTFPSYLEFMAVGLYVVLFYAVCIVIDKLRIAMLLGCEKKIIVMTEKYWPKN